MIGSKKNSDFKYRGEMAFSLQQEHPNKPISSMRTSGTLSVELLLSTGRARSRRCNPDELTGRAVYKDTILRESEDGYFFTEQWIRSKSETSTEIDADYGNCRGVPWAKYESETARACCFSLSSSRVTYFTIESGVGSRYHVYSTYAWFCIFSRNTGLVFSVCCIVAAFEQLGYTVLQRGFGRSTREELTRDFQYGPRVPVYERRVYGTVEAEGNQNQYGFSGKSFRQHICRAAVEKRKIRRCVPQGLSNYAGSSKRFERLFWVLQSRAISSGVGLPNSGTGVLWRKKLRKIIHRPQEELLLCVLKKEKKETKKRKKA